MVEGLIDRILVDEATLQRRIADLGETLSREYAGSSSLILICVLRGGVVFMTDLMRHIRVPHEIDFMAVSSYGTGVRETCGQVRILMDLKTNIENRDVLVVEDIIDSGYTLECVVRMLHERHPASLEVCTLLNKSSRRKVDVPVRYVGFEIPDEFVFGYGLDLDEHWRNLPYVAVFRQPSAEA